MGTILDSALWELVLKWRVHQTVTTAVFVMDGWDVRDDRSGRWSTRYAEEEKD